MMENKNIPKFVETFFKACEIDEKLNRYAFFLIRYDGVVLYHNNSQVSSQSNKSSIGALLGGIWQAAKALAEFIPNEEKADGYRLSFDTTSQGVYIIPLSLKSEELYLGLIYHDEVNPGFIKNKMRDIAVNLSGFLEEGLKNSSEKNRGSKKEENHYLFGDISDSEMDRLFAFAKN